MPSSALTSDNSAIVMIDHAAGFGNVFRSHGISLHVNNTVGLAKTAGVFGIPLVLTNGADTGPYGPLFSELRAETGGARDRPGGKLHQRVPDPGVRRGHRIGRQYQLAPNATSLINDVVLTSHGAYFTDSYNPDIYEIPIGPSGHLGRAVTTPLSGPVAAFSTAGLNLNGIAATADGNTLIVDNTVLDKLFTVNPVTGASAAINVAGLIPDSMDGLLLEGASLWVVENTANTVVRVTLSHDLSSGTITSTITSPLFDNPTTAAKYGDELALPNGRYDLGLPPPFGPGAPPGTTFNVVVVPAF